MKKYLAFIFLLVIGSASAQKITISGTAYDTTKGRNWVRITLNDTIRKYLSSRKYDHETYMRFSQDTVFSKFAMKDGKFQMTANLTDSLFFQSSRHITQVYLVADLAKMNKVEIHLEPEVCIPYERCYESIASNLYVFIGQKINVTEDFNYYCNFYSWDGMFQAEYKILQQLKGKPIADTIRFTVFDHYGKPPFGKYQNALLFVGEYCGKLIHEKYQYFELFKTEDGKWASPGDPYKYDTHLKKEIKARKLHFPDSVWFDISNVTAEMVKKNYPAPFYKIESNRAIPVMGSYVDDLLKVKKASRFKSWSAFKN